MQSDEVAEVKRLVRAASSCVGPCGRARAVRSSDAPGARTFITSSAAAALQSWPVAREHHVLRLVVDTVDAHLRHHRDGGWLFINFCLRVTLALLGLDGTGSHLDLLLLPRSAALHGLALAATWMAEALADEQCPCRHKLEWSDLTSVLALLRSNLCKPVAVAAVEDARHLSITILEAFLEVLPASSIGSTSPEADVRVAWFCGPEVCWSSTLHGLLLDTPAAIATTSRRGEDSCLVLFDVSLEQWLPGVAADGSQPVGLEHYTVESQYSSRLEDANAFRKWELSQFMRLANSLLDEGVNALACQKLVDPWLTDYLRQRGVTVLARLSLRHIQHVQRLSGATPVTSLAALPSRWADVSGTVGAIEARTICERTYTIILPADKKSAPRNQGEGSVPACVSTLLIGAPDEHALSELRRIVPQAIHSLSEVAQTGLVLEGAGLTEVYLAGVLIDRARKLLSESGENASVCTAVCAVAECLRDSAACLRADSGFSGRGVSGREEFLEATEAAICRLQAGGQRLPGAVLEAERPKRDALLGALNLAGVLLRLGGTLDLVNHSLG